MFMSPAQLSRYPERRLYYIQLHQPGSDAGFRCLSQNLTVYYDFQPIRDVVSTGPLTTYVSTPE
jgi:hypothetical protein